MNAGTGNVNHTVVLGSSYHDYSLRQEKGTTVFRINPQRFIGTLLCLVVASLSLAFCAREIDAQEVSVVAQAGSSTPGSYQLNGIDTINLHSGAVVLNIPVLSYPQLGEKLKLSFSLKYSPTFWYYTAGAPAVNSNSVMEYTGTWSNSNPAGATPTGVTLTRDQALLPTTVVLGYPCSSDGGINNCPPPQNRAQASEETISASLYSLVSSDGAVHNFGINDNNNHYLYMPTVDGSNFVPVGTGPKTPTTFLGANGIKYMPVSSSADPTLSGFNQVDPDGNTIAMSATGWTDSIGRSIPGTLSGPGDGNPTRSTAGEPFPGISSTDLSNCSAGSSAARVWNVPGPNTGTLTYTLCFTPFTASTAFATSNSQPAYNSLFITEPGGQGSGSYLLLTQLVLPNKTSYTFSYDSWLELTSVTLPTGASITYGWQTTDWSLNVPHQQSRGISTRSMNNTDGTSQTWTYTYTGRGFINDALITDPSNNDEEHTFGVGPNTSSTQETIHFYNGTGSSRTLLKTVTLVSAGLPNPFIYPGGPTPLSGPLVSKAISLADTNQMSLETYTLTPATGNYSYYNFNQNTGPALGPHTYIAYTCACWSTLQTQAVSEYDYGSGGPGPLLRTTTTTYQWQQSSAYQAANLLDLPSKTVVSTASGAWVGETDYAYDENNGSPQGVLGNLTSVTRVNSLGPSPTSHTVYTSQGVPFQWQDANGNLTYVSSWQCSNLFPQQVISAHQSQTTLPETTTSMYDCNTGKLTSSQDPNGMIAQYSYYDPLNRLTLLQKAVGTPAETWTSISYPSMTQTNIFQDKATKADGRLQSSIVYDGFGRQIHSIGPDGTTVDTMYDPMGRGQVASVSNPYFSISDPTYGITSYSYDSLGRKTQQVQSDGTSKQHWSYSGFSVTFTDENGNQWVRTSDALGRLSNVQEPGGQETSYSYDLLNNLLTVNQAGLTGGTPRNRSFTYDSLSRLLCASNPENTASPQQSCPSTAPSSASGWPSGVVLYSYDANGNVQSRTDARGVVTSYGYDSLNRLVSNSYGGSDTLTPGSCMQYDTSSAAGSGSNLIGRLTNEWTIPHSQSCPANNGAPAAGYLTLRSILNYDPMGRVTGEQQCTTPANCTATAPTQFSLSYGYDLAGNRTSYNNGVGSISIANTFDSAGQLNLVNATTVWNDPQHPSLLFSLPSYSPAGGLTSASYGPSLLMTRGYDNRLRPTGETVQQTNFVP